MSINNNIKFLLDLEEENIVENNFLRNDYVVLKNGVTAKRIHFISSTKFYVCPFCGQIIYKLHDYRTVDLKYNSCGPQPLIVSIKKKRFECEDCNKTITEDLKCVKKHCFISNKVYQSITFSLKKIDSLTDIANNHNVSTSTVYRSLQKVDNINLPNTLPSVLSFDEFKANTSEGKYAFLVVDPINKSILEILSDRKFSSVYKYFSRFNRKVRNRVKYIISDLWEPYRQIILKLFPNATLVADKFHYQRVVNVALNSVRKRISNSLDNKTAYQIKRNWRLLNKNFDDINDKRRYFSHLLKRPVTDYEVLNYILSLNSELANAHSLYQDFLYIINLDNSEKQIQLLDKWLELAIKYNISEFDSVIKTIKKWYKPICSSFIKYEGRTLSNGFIEGCNNKIKVIKRVSFGYRSFINFRKRILLVFY
ncbi:ISL3 family transposase [Anaerovorax odorimutans]|uniref:ISL3 family transposase n=1 Tax=Anaerovorax odorimutans TaxID=109327 RepID=UPI00041D4B13|nr:ISL3 family transposase [Anaerovorax odorimutans]